MTTERLPPPVVRGLSRAASALPLARGLPRTLHRARRFAIALGSTPEERHLKWTGYFTGELRERIVGAELRSLDRDPPHRKLAQPAELSRATHPTDPYMA